MFGKIICLILFLGSLTARAQDVLEMKLDGSEQGKSLTVLLESMEKKYGARFYFRAEWLDPISCRKCYAGQTLEEVLDNLFHGTELSYFVMYPNAVVIVKDPTQVLLRNQAIETARLQQKKVQHYTFGDVGNPKEGSVIISGAVLDSRTAEPMPGTSVQVSDIERGTTTDEQGKYTLLLRPGVHVLTFSFVDYEDKVIDLTAYEDGKINIEMEEVPTMLGEVVIEDRAAQEVTTGRIGQIQLTMSDIKRAPTLLGESDLIRHVQTLPGVTTVGEAASGFNVRGGSVDQNLILYDGMPVFNPSHLFGFLSTFNSESVGDAAFFRGGIPAAYGGRVSSVLDIQSKDGNYEKWKGQAGIGMITSNVMASGPLTPKRTSLAASFRTTYSNWLVHAIRTDYADLRNSSAAFYDGTVKFTHIIDDRTKLSLTTYTSRDAFRLTGDSTYQWNNFQISAKLDHQFTTRLNSEIVAGQSTYRYNVVNRYYATASELSYHIHSYLLKAGFNYQAINHKVNFGMQLLFYRFNPGSLQPKSPASNARHSRLDKQNSVENALYFSDEWSLNEKTTVEAGLRVPMFVSLGPAWVNEYEKGIPRESGGATDSLYFGAGKVIKTYSGLEPRVSVRWITGPASSIKLGYNRMYQFLHLISNTTAVTPVDIWQPSGYYFKPQRANQISLGYFKDFHEKKYGASTETFYKSIKNILDFKDGAQLILNRHLETELLQGKGFSYGVETSFFKNTGRLTGALNYTWSRSFRQIKGSAAGESVNSGKIYPASSDQPHILNVSWKYNLSRRYFFTGNFTYHTGRPVTIPISAFAVENTTVAYFSGRNQYRIPDYHRLDLALVIQGNNKRKKNGEATWVISVYNVYARKNPYSVFFKSSGSGIPKPYQLSIIGTALPSISYNFRF